MRVVGWTFILRVLGSECLSQPLGPQQGPCGPLALAPQGHFPILDVSPVAQGTWHSDWLRLGGVFHPKACVLEAHLEPGEGVEPRPALEALS